MPKVVSRFAISSSADARPTASSAADLSLYYCICGEFALVIDKPLTSLPRRPTDNAIIVRAQENDGHHARVFKLNTKIENPILLSRTGGHERQYRHTCTRCSLPVAYQSTPPPDKPPFIYILAGALTQMQGQLPPDAFEGESESVES